MASLLVDPQSGWKYGFPKIWDFDKPYNESSWQEKQAWLISKGYPEQLAKQTYLRSWIDPDS
jgi:hypothetical protein